MQYRLLLTNTDTKENTEIFVPADMVLEELSAHIKVALNLPYVDYAWHRFQASGIAYMTSDRSEIDEEVRGEYELPTLDYASSEHTALNQVFTTLESSIVYLQEDSFKTYKVRCTLLERIDDELPESEMPAD
ncbi:MAG: hypothetical protein MJZ75_00835 [Paludibacteraceae bacterium]|nr:hypothetical protein [Paludibacteraceae bacterium]